MMIVTQPYTVISVSSAIPPDYRAVVFPQITLQLFLYIVCHLESSSGRLLLRGNRKYQKIYRLLRQV